MLVLTTLTSSFSPSGSVGAVPAPATTQTPARSTTLITTSAEAWVASRAHERTGVQEGRVRLTKLKTTVAAVRTSIGRYATAQIGAAVNRTRPPSTTRILAEARVRPPHEVGQGEHQAEHRLGSRHGRPSFGSGSFAGFQLSNTLKRTRS